MPRAPQTPPPGIRRNATPENTPGAWFDGNNVRWRQGQLIPIGGNVALPAAVTADTPRDLLTWHDNSHVRWAAIGTDSKLYAFNFDLKTLYDITPTGVGPLEPPGPYNGYGLGDYGSDTYGTARDAADIGPQDIAADMGDKWSLDTWGQDLLLVPTQDGHLFHWSPTAPATLPAIVANAPINNRGVIVTDQRSAVLLGAGGDPRNIAWSDQEDFTVWAPDVSNLAGSKFLQTQSTVLTAVKVSSGVLIFTTNDLHTMVYVGPPYAYGITQTATGCGPLSHRAPVTTGATAIWPGLQTFWQWAGTVLPLACDVGDWFYSMLNRTYAGRVFGSPNPSFSELWWDWPDEGNTECNRYLAVNVGVSANQLGATVASHIWLIGSRTRTAADFSGTMDYPVLGGPLGSGGSLFLHEYGWTDNGAPRAPAGEVYVESGAIALGEGDRRFNVTQVIPDYVSQHAEMIGYSFASTEQPQSTADAFTRGPYTVVHNGLVDVKLSGRSVLLRLEAMLDGEFTVGRPRLVISPAGLR
jgi:hypothetical protein